VDPESTAWLTRCSARWSICENFQYSPSETLKKRPRACQPHRRSPVHRLRARHAAAAPHSHLSKVYSHLKTAEWRPGTQAESAPSARRARMPLAASAGAPDRPRTSGAMRRPLLLRHTTRTRRHAREQSRLCSLAKEVLRTPRHCQVVGNTRGDASLVEREHQGHLQHASRPLEGSAGHVDAGLAGAPPSVCSRATRRNA